MRELSPLLWRYRVGLSATVLAFAVTLFLPTLASPLPFALFIAAVLASAWHGGLAPGLVATSRTTAHLPRRPRELEPWNHLMPPRSRAAAGSACLCSPGRTCHSPVWCPSSRKPPTPG
jgi:hypothetical protein